MTTTTLTRCIYCNKDKPATDFSQEHLIPQALGGALMNNPFAISEVCRQCNSAAGWFVDRPFIRTQYIQMARSVEFQKFANIAAGEKVPLSFMGEIEGLTLDENICDFWLGPAGDQIYHFHKPYPDPSIQFTPIHTGYPAGKIEFDPGFVIVFISATNPYWHKTIYNSAVGEFSKSKIYGGNFDAPSGNPPAGVKDLIISFRDKTTQIPCKFSISVMADHRFLAKLCLGFGAKYLGKNFTESKDAEILRSFYRERDPVQRETIPFRGQSSLNMQESGLSKQFSWRRGHVIGLMPIKNGLALISSFFGTPPSITLITNNESHWKGRIPDEGMVYFVSPGLKKWVGPIDLINFTAHQISAHRNKELDALALEEDCVPPHPPYILPNQPLK